MLGIRRFAAKALIIAGLLSQTVAFADGLAYVDIQVGQLPWYKRLSEKTENMLRKGCGFLGLGGRHAMRIRMSFEAEPYRISVDATGNRIRIIDDWIPRQAERSAQAAHEQAFEVFDKKFDKIRESLAEMHGGLENWRSHATTIYIGAPWKKSGFGTMQVTYPNRQSEFPLPFDKNLAPWRYEAKEYDSKVYPIWDVKTGETLWLDLEKDGRRVQGTAQLSEINSQGFDALPALFMAAEVDLYRRALDPNFILPAEFVLHCPEENIDVYKKLGFELIQDTPARPGLYAMKISAQGFHEIHRKLAHRPTARLIREAGITIDPHMEWDLKIQSWVKDKRPLERAQGIKNFFSRVDRRYSRYFGAKPRPAAPR